MLRDLLRCLGPRQTGRAGCRPVSVGNRRAIERSHHIDGEQFSRRLDAVVIDDSALFSDELQESENS